MGAANWNKVATSVIYAIDDEDEFIWDDTRDNVCAELEAIDKDPDIDWEFYPGDRLKTSCNNSISMGMFYSDIPNIDPPVQIEILVKTVSGYHSGFCLDFEVSLLCEEVYGNYDEDEASIIFDDMLEDYPDMLKQEDRGAFVKKVEAKIVKGRALIEGVFNNHTDQYEVLASFSNGETIYGLVDNKKGEK